MHRGIGMGGRKGFGGMGFLPDPCDRITGAKIGNLPLCHLSRLRINGEPQSLYRQSRLVKGAATVPIL